MNKILYKLRAIFKGNYKGLNKTVNEIHEKTNKPKISIFFDILWCLVLYGAGHNDYRVFAFYSLTSKERDTYLTRFRNKKITDVLNNSEYSEYFDNKATFNKKFKEYLKRDAYDIKDLDLKDFENVIKKHPVLFCKPYNGDSGKGIERLNVKDFKSPALMKKYIEEKNIGVLEEIVVQDKRMAKVNPHAVNCIRLVTVLNGNDVDLLYGVVKFGTTTDYVDNMGRGGSVSGPIDVKTGKVLYDLKDMHGRVFSEHPTSHIKFIGFEIPAFEEAVKLVKKAAKVVPQVRQVGWDVAITEKGPAIIEGNNWTDYMFSQLPEHTKDKIGLMPYYRKLLDKRS